MAAEPIVRVDHLKKYFPVTKGLILQKVVGNVQAVDDVSFNINEGETFSVVGETGCGKTTTSKLLLRLEKPTSGHVYLDGKDIHAISGDDLRRYRTQVQAVFQDPWSSLNPRHSARRLIEEPLLLHAKLGAAERRARAEALAERVHLDRAMLDRLPSELSGGQLQRIDRKSTRLNSSHT